MVPVPAVHYIGRLDATGDIFVDTRSEGDAVKIVAGRGERFNKTLTGNECTA